MSYEPTLIVEREDLEKFEDELVKLDLEDNEIGKYLYGLISDSCWCTFKKMQIYVFQPEFSSFNKDVRNWLSKHNIEYSEIN